MKTVLHKAEERGAADHGWLQTRYSFSFADWYRADRIGFGALRVLNDDLIAPLSGFPMHGHRDMEIITVVTEGAVRHTDSLGNQGNVGKDEVQVMSAGTGVVHSEENVSPDGALRLFQMWIKPRAQNVPPRYAQKAFDFTLFGSTLLVSPDGAQGSLSIQQEAWISYVRVEKGTSVPSPVIGDTKGLYVFALEGSWRVGDIELGPRDALGISEVREVDLLALTDATALLIEVPL